MLMIARLAPHGWSHSYTQDVIEEALDHLKNTMNLPCKDTFPKSEAHNYKRAYCDAPAQKKHLLTLLKPFAPCQTESPNAILPVSSPLSQTQARK